MREVMAGLVPADEGGYSYSNKHRSEEKNISVTQGAEHPELNGRLQMGKGSLGITAKSHVRLLPTLRRLFQDITS